MTEALARGLPVLDSTTGVLNNGGGIGALNNVAGLGGVAEGAGGYLNALDINKPLSDGVNAGQAAQNVDALNVLNAANSFTQKGSNTFTKSEDYDKHTNTDINVKDTKVPVNANDAYVEALETNLDDNRINNSLNNNHADDAFEHSLNNNHADNVLQNVNVKDVNVGDVKPVNVEVSAPTSKLTTGQQQQYRQQCRQRQQCRRAQRPSLARYQKHWQQQ